MEVALSATLDVVEALVAPSLTVFHASMQALRVKLREEPVSDEALRGVEVEAENLYAQRAANAEGKEDYEFQQFVEDVQIFRRRELLLAKAVRGECVCEWESVVEVWKKCITSAKTTWCLVINQFGEEIDLPQHGETEANRESLRAIRLLHTHLYLFLLFAQLRTVRLCLCLARHMSEQAPLSLKTLHLPLSDGQLLGESLSLSVCVLASLQSYYSVDVVRTLRLSVHESDALVRRGELRSLCDLLSPSVPSSSSSSSSCRLQDVDILPLSLLPAELSSPSHNNERRSDDESDGESPTDLEAFFHRVCRLQGASLSHALSALLSEEALCVVRESVLCCERVYHGFLSRKKKSTAAEAVLTLAEWKAQVHGCCIVSVARFWNAAKNDRHGDLLFANGFLFCLSQLPQLLSPNAVQLPQQPLHHSSLIAAAAVATRLMDRCDARSHCVGLSLLSFAVRECTVSAAIVDFAEYCLSKLLQIMEIVTHPIAQVLSFRLVQVLLSTSEQSFVLLKNGHVLLQTIADDINRDFAPFRVWVKLIPLHITLLVMPIPIIACQLSPLIDALLHALNLWHAPSQRLVFSMLTALCTRLPDEMSWSIGKILTELFRVKIYYIRRVLPDVCSSDDETIAALMTELNALIDLIAKTKFPREYREWYEDVSSPSALSALFKEQHMKQRGASNKAKKSVTSLSMEKEESSLEFVSFLIDEYHHALLTENLL